MIIQFGNIVSGFILAAPKLKEMGAKGQIEQVEAKLNPVRGVIGLIVLIAAVVSFLQSIGLVYLNYYLFGAGPLQALVGLLIGLILCATWFEKFPKVHEFILKLKAYEIWIGMVGIVIGIIGLL